jgi:hypothetical protein
MELDLGKTVAQLIADQHGSFSGHIDCVDCGAVSFIRSAEITGILYALHEKLRYWACLPWVNPIYAYADSKKTLCNVV